MFEMKKPFFNGARSMFLIYLIWLCAMTTLGLADIVKSNVTVNVGYVLDMTEVSEKMSFLSVSLALEDFYKSNQDYYTRILLHPTDSQGTVVSATAAALDLMVFSEVEAIIGPTTSKQASFMISLGEKAHVPVISYSATSPLLSSTHNPYFFRATLNDSTQVKAISSLVQEFGWREVVAIHGENEFGEGIVPFLTDALQDINCRVHNRSVISLNATDTDIKSELYSLSKTGKRVFIVHLVDSLAVRLFKNAKEIGMLDKGYAWIVTNEIGNQLDNKNSTVLNTMQGILGIKNYMPSTRELDNFKYRCYMEFRSQYPDYFQNVELDTFGVWAHDAAVALAFAVEKVFSSGDEDLFGYQRNNVTGNSTHLDILGVSKAGPKLRDALSNLSFKGFAGNVSFVNGEIPPSAFQIVNVVGNGVRGIGFWTPNSGLTRDLTETVGNSKSHLGVIIWPGDTASPPKGWVVPKDGKRLRIGVPMKDGFHEFVKVTRDPHTHTATKVTGYCIDVFEAVMRAMPYSILFDYIPFALPNGSSTGSYNDLTYQVALGNFDAVVGDITIVANRTSYIDYTLPYTESGASLIVPLKDPMKKSPWIFLKPLTWRLWFWTAVLFCLIAITVWVLEHEANDDLKGSRWYQGLTVLWFSFSIMVFAQKEKTVNNLTRCILVAWFFVVLILTQSYTASLTSMLTVQRLQPVATNIQDFTSGGHYVGYQRGSYVLAILKEMNFDESRLKVYDSVETLYAALINGSSNGGISAAFDEIPYLQIFMGQHCSEYAMVGPKYKTAGFGFVFPKNDPVVSDVSSAILNVTQGEEMKLIEKAWFGQQNTCQDKDTIDQSYSIGMDSFWLLFVSIVAICALALILYRCFLCLLPSHKTLWKALLKDGRPRFPSSYRWEPPPVGYIKMNLDGAFDTFDSRGAFSWTAKNSEGIVLHISALPIQFCTSSLESVGQAMLNAMKFAASQRWNEVIFESDCSSLVEAVICLYDLQMQAPWFKECVHLLSQHDRWHVVLIRPEANVIADLLAKKAKEELWSWSDLNALPLGFW